MDHTQLETLSLPELVERLEDLEGRRTPVGWSPDDAVERAAVERRILELVRGAPDAGERDESLCLPCDLAVRIRTRHDSCEGRIRDVGFGGVFVTTDERLPLGSHVYVEAGEGLRARGKIAWHDHDDVRGLGISFTDQPSEAHERRLRRFVRELLRHHIEPQN